MEKQKGSGLTTRLRKKSLEMARVDLAGLLNEASDEIERLRKQKDPSINSNRYFVAGQTVWLMQAPILVELISMEPNGKIVAKLPDRRGYLTVNPDQLLPYTSHNV